MTDMLEKGLAWLDAMNAKFRGTPVIYRRGGAEIEIIATIGRSNFELADEAGIIENYETRDFLVSASALLLEGQPFLPRAGDRIVETIGDKRLINEVLALGNEPPFKWCDPYRRTLRIHTKYITEETL